MTGAIDREFAVQILIALVVTAGAWMMFVEPRMSELSQLEQTIQTAESGGAQAGLPVDELANHAATVRANIRTIAQQNRVALHSSDLYARIKRLADEHDIIVQTIRPGSSAEQTEQSSVRMMRIDLSVEGAYANTAAFLDAVGTVGGFVRPASLTIVPLTRNGVDLVTARYVCEILQFELPDTLKGFVEAGHGE